MRKKILIAGVALARLASPLIVAYILLDKRLNTIYSIPYESLPVNADPAQVARGEHLVTVLMGCTDCQSEDLGGEILKRSAR